MKVFYMSTDEIVRLNKFICEESGNPHVCFEKGKIESAINSAFYPWQTRVALASLSYWRTQMKNKRKKEKELDPVSLVRKIRENNLKKFNGNLSEYVKYLKEKYEKDDSEKSKPQKLKKSA